MRSRNDSEGMESNDAVWKSVSGDEALLIGLNSEDAEEASSSEFSEDTSSELHDVDPHYSDTMSLHTFNAGSARLENFIEKTENNEPISFVELYQVFDVGAKFTDFLERAANGTATFVTSDDVPQHRRMAAEAFNRSSPEMKEYFLTESMGNAWQRAGILMLFTQSSVVGDIMDIRYTIDRKLQDVGDVIEQKNKERYEAVAKMPAYSTVVAARRAEVEAMLDAGNQKEYLATQRM